MDDETVNDLLGLQPGVDVAVEDRLEQILVDVAHGARGIAADAIGDVVVDVEADETGHQVTKRGENRRTFVAPVATARA